MRGRGLCSRPGDGAKLKGDGVVGVAGTCEAILQAGAVHGGGGEVLFEKLAGHGGEEVLGGCECVAEEPAARNTVPTATWSENAAPSVGRVTNSDIPSRQVDKRPWIATALPQAHRSKFVFLWETP